MSDKVFPPSTKHLNNLRVLGKAPVSALTNFLFAIIFVTIFLLFSLDDYITLLNQSVTDLKISNYTYLFLELLLAPSLIFVFSYFLMQLIQTRFLIITLKIDFSRLFHLKISFFGTILKIILSVIVLAIGLSFGFYCFKVTTPEFLALLSFDSTHRNHIIQEILTAGLFKYLILALVVAFLSWRIAIYNFMISNKMTKQEYEAEEQ